MTDLLDYATARQAELIQAVRSHGSMTEAARALGIARSTIRSAVKRVKRKAASQGFSPDHDMTNTVPEGYSVKGVSTMYGPNGEVRAQWVKSQQDKDDQREAFLEAVRELAEPFRGKSKTKPLQSSVSEELLSVYGWGDMHLGMLAWGAEAGADFDLKIAEATYRAAVDRVTAVSPPSAQALIIAVGDNLHTNSSDWLTPKSKHQLDGDSRFQKVLSVGARVLRYTVEAALEKHRHVTLMVALGNHDFDSSAGLALALQLLFEDNERVTVDRTPGRFHYYRFGQCFIGVTHGDTAKPPKLPLLMATRRPEDWGSSTHRKWYTGHLHTEILRDYGGCVVETLATISPKDAYAAEYGYDSARKTIVDVWHQEHGLEARHSIGISRL